MSLYTVYNIIFMIIVYMFRFLLQSESNVQVVTSASSLKNENALNV